MAPLRDIISHLDELLEIDRFSDLGPNGLQVPGASEVTRVASGVTASLELIERAAQEEAQLLLVHHGLFWSFKPRTVSPLLKRRLEALFGAGMSLAGYHLPLDAHPELGNNALLAEGLGAESHEPWGDYEGTAIGRLARFAGEGVAAAELFTRVRDLTQREPLVLPGGPERVRTLGVISGGATSEFAQAIADGLDAYLTGEAAEWVMTEGREAGVHYISAGHYATETFGVRSLGERLAERFGVEHAFIDVPNPV